MGMDSDGDKPDWVSITGHDGSSGVINQGRFPVDWQKSKIDRRKETTSVDIGQGLVDVLVRLPNELPESFKDGCVQVADWLTRLDKNDASVLEDEKAKEWLGQFARGTNVATLVNLGLKPKTSLPEWLVNDEIDIITNQMFGDNSLTADQEEQMAKAFNKWGRQGNYKCIRASNGVAAILKEIPEEGKTESFKVYLQGINAYSAFMEDRMSRAIGVLGENSPIEIKLYEGSFVMYFRGYSDSPDEIRERLRDVGVNVSPWAQDVYVVDENGQLRFEFSNDDAHKLFDKEMPTNYDQADMFGRYINYCLASGKKPERPFETCFVYSECDGVVEDKTTYPVVKSKSKLRVM